MTYIYSQVRREVVEKVGKMEKEVADALQGKYSANIEEKEGKKSRK